MVIVYFGNRNYSDLQTRGHTRFEQLFKVMIQNYRIKEIFYISPPKSLREALKTGLLPKIKRIDDKLTTINTTFFLPKGFANPLNNLILRFLIQRTLNKLVSKDIIIWSVWGVNYYGWPRIVCKLKGILKVHDFVELPHSLLGLTRWIDDSYNLLVNNCDILFVNSSKSLDYLTDRFKDSSCNVKCVYNGIHLVKKKFKAVKKDKVVIGVVSIFSPWIVDYDFLLNMIKNNPDWTFRLTGRVLPETLNIHKTELNEIANAPNVMMNGYISGSDLDKELTHISWGLSPVVNDSSLIFGDSLKKYLYLSRGIPVLSTEPIDASHPLYNMVYHIGGLNNEKIRNIVNNKPDIDSFNPSFHTWDQRMDEMLDMVNEKHLSKYNMEIN